METRTPTQAALYQWLWRWHGYAGLFVIPFIFWMALTGLPYVWENEIENAFHPEFRDLTPQASRLSYEEQLAAAQDVAGEMPLRQVTADHDPRHATQFIFGPQGDPLSVFINPYDGSVITSMKEWSRLVFATKSLHGLTFIEPYGSWLLELLACWGIVLCITGVYLWWPRMQAWRVWGVFVPRLSSDGRTRWRDLHAVTGFYVAVVLVGYLLTGLPWTAFWGGKILGGVQGAFGQGFPMTLTAFSGLNSKEPAANAKPLPIDAFVRFGLDQNLPGPIMVEMPGIPMGTVHVRNRVKRGRDEIHFQLDLFTAKPVATTRWEDLPSSQKVVATGINLHEGQLFGRATQILSTVLACIFMLLAGAGFLTWWKRRPQGRLDWPSHIAPIRVPAFVKSGACVLGLLFPLFGASLLVCLFRGKVMRRPAGSIAGQGQAAS
jgi:uncharacterized iron-regulated membrane protein